jgi:putative lipoprotein
MEAIMAYELEPSEQPQQSGGGSGNQGLIIGIVVALIVIAVLAFLLLSNRGDDGTAATPTFTPTFAPTSTPTAVQEEGSDQDGAAVIPTPRPGFPFFTVSAGDGVNVRSGPGTEFPVVASLPGATTGEVTGITEDGQWLSIIAPQSPGGLGWIAAGLVTVSGLENVPVIPPAGGEATATPTPEAGVPVIAFTAEPTVIQAGACAELRWEVQNVSEVYVYPAGAAWQDFPVEGQSNQEVCPEETTTYEMRVVLANGSVDTRQITIQVQQPDAPENPLADTAWTLAALNLNQVPVPDSVITLNFTADGVAAGNAGCNDYSGSYTVESDLITIGTITATGQACEDALMAQESAYLAALQSVTEFTQEGNQLVLFDGSGNEVLRLNPQ